MIQQWKNASLLQLITFYMYLGLNSGPHNPHIGALQLSFLEIQNLRIKKKFYF